MHVLHVVLGLEIGGLEAFVLDLTRAYAGTVTSTIVCLRSKGAIMAKDTSHVNIVRLDGEEAFSWALVWKLCALIRREQIDVVHTHNPGPHLYGALAGRFCGKPVIHTKHGRNYPDNRRKVYFNRLVTMLTQRIIAVSQDAEAVCRDIESVPARKLRTILNGTDTRIFSRRSGGHDLRRELGLDDDIPIIGIVARLSRIKNHSLLFRSALELSRRGVRYLLVVVGDGPLEHDLRNEVVQLGLQDTVRFLGARSDVAQLYPQLDVFVLSSISEGVSLTLLEAMSCELPVVATRVGGNPEVVDDGVTGFIVEETPNGIADALERLVGSEDCASLRRSMGQAGRSRVEARFSMEQTAAAYMEEYRELIGGNGVAQA